MDLAQFKADYSELYQAIFDDGVITCTPSNASGTVFDNVTDVSISCI